MHPTKSRTLGGVAAILAICGIAAAAWAFHDVKPAPASGGPCSGSSSLGSVVYLLGSDLHVLDLSSCEDQVLAHHAAAPVRWSPDGKWIAFGDARVIRASGGRVHTPLGDGLRSWAWSPSEDLLAGVTKLGGVMTGGPGHDSERVAPDTGGATSLAFSPDGGRLAVAAGGRERGIHVEDLRTRSWHLVGRAQLGASPLLAGWSPDGRWLLFWLEPSSSVSLGADGLALEAVRSSGGSPKVIAPTLLYPDFLAACGDGVVVSAGRSRSVTSGKRLIDVAPPSWSPVRISRDPSRSWFWPSCTTDGRVVATTSTKNVEERRFDAAERSIWLSRPGARPFRLIGRDGDGLSDEFPRWSADGRYVMFVRHAASTDARAQLVLASMSGSRATVVGPVAKLSPQLGYYGHDDWAAVSDWYRPA